MLATAFGASAVDYTHTLVVNKTDGTKVEYKFADMPVAMIEGNDLKMQLAGSEESVLYPIADIVNLTFEKKVSGVESVVGEEGRVTFGISHESLEAAGIEPGAEVSVYNAAGMLCIKAQCGADGSVSVNISTLDKGVYVVNAGKNTFKFIR